MKSEKTADSCRCNSASLCGFIHCPNFAFLPLFFFSVLCSLFPVPCSLTAVLHAQAGPGFEGGLAIPGTGGTAHAGAVVGPGNTAVNGVLSVSSGAYVISSTLMGYPAGYGLSSGNGHLFIGFQAGYNVIGAACNVVIIYDSNTSAPTAGNQFKLGGMLYGDLPDKIMDIRAGAQQAAFDIVSAGTLQIRSGSKSSVMGGNPGRVNAVGGYLAGYSLCTGSADNIFVGFQAGYSVTSGTDDIVICDNKDASGGAANNEFNAGGGICAQYAQIWCISTGLMAESMTATGKLYAAIPPTGDNPGDHIAASTPQMAAYDVGIDNFPIGSFLYGGFPTGMMDSNGGLGLPRDAWDVVSTSTARRKISRIGQSECWSKITPSPPFAVMSYGGEIAWLFRLWWAVEAQLFKPFWNLQCGPYTFME
ncbi:MAG: hypothetical protein A2X34_04890 [Elusimicrobia bacterium GWC2_51_8]|nr:MAG: hypothetical protein A2X33_06505 [Elusimicrobia bacterium GWA2_51_34]OGR57955.1 MAG: hypothetical protein A2X34_04890 [Elusimicrobia bacterium GWC2_51_8]OGR86770.1 MAG: hypothetical protein A2021_09800 [Elusimicrobia bacterium GWF2_52_66]HAF95092.1 hypothetical protein [Elusimicrobiota bacterium]HCE99045.1 hypothetical protein [Elusimicrobiota bacterium]